MPSRAVLRLLAIMLILGTGWSTREARASDEAWRKLREPGVVVLMRHAYAPGGGDPPHFRIDDCATQRNLDETGRQQARRTGAAFRDRGVIFDRVLTSQWCRCRETARLVMKKEVEPLPALNSFFGKSEKGPGQLAELRRYLAALPLTERVLLVTHHVVIVGMTGIAPQSGELVIAKRVTDGRLEALGRLRVE